jgi:regulator of replication initiation timing
VQEQVARLGEGRIDFEQMPTNFTTKFLRMGCPCSASGECSCGSKASCGTECAAASQAACKCCPCSGESLGVKHEAKCGEEGCDLTDVIVKRVQHFDESLPGPHKLMQQIATLMAEKAAAQAALAVRKEADEQIGEIYEAMAELLADNAALDAKLEAQTEQRKLIEKVSELATENARLKTHIELAAERAAIAHATTALALENEKLKLRLAELEQKHAVAEAARTAGKPRSERKQR